MNIIAQAIPPSCSLSTRTSSLFLRNQTNHTMISAQFVRFAPYFFLGAVALMMASYVRSLFRLRNLPGPFVARFTGLFRLSLVSKGNGPQNYRALRQKYGPIVRVGPNAVSISDVAMIPTIYGIGSKFTKVRTGMPSWIDSKG